MADGEIRVVSAKELTTERIRALIHAGEWSPRERLSIEDLARRFGLSRTPVRDALWQLSSEGLVEIVPRVGIFVRTISAREVIEVYRAKGALEPLMAQWATERGSQEQRDELYRSLEPLRQAAESGDVDKYVELVEQRRRMLLKMAASPVLDALFAVIDGRVRLLRYRNLSQPGRLLVSANQHALVAEAVRAGDAAGAFHAMHVHMQDAENRVRNLLDSQEGISEDSSDPEWTDKQAEAGGAS